MKKQKDPLLQSFIEELVNEHKCHTVILFGSHARGDIEGNFRRSWLQESLLHEYFELRERRSL